MTSTVPEGSTQHKFHDKNTFNICRDLGGAFKHEIDFKPRDFVCHYLSKGYDVRHNMQLLLKQMIGQILTISESGQFGA